MTADADCRCLFRAGEVAMPLTDVAPSGSTPTSADERARLADFLDVVLMKPLHHSAQQHRMNVEQSLNTMTRAERVYLEIEMTERAKVTHSYDYDALRF